MTVTIPMTSAAPVAVVDVVSSLLESALVSVFRAVGEGSPHISRATVEVRRPLQEIVLANQRRSRELAELLESIGGNPSVNPTINSGDQYLAYLSLKFLLPKLVAEKKLCVQRYENALAGIKRLPQVPPQVPAVLNRHLEEERAELAVLQGAADHVSASRNGKAQMKDPSQPAAGTKAGSDAGPSAG